MRYQLPEMRGGAAYDQLTDAIVRRLTGCDPPRHAVVSGTLRLDVDREFPAFATADPAGQLAQVRRTLRDLEFHAERHLVPVDGQPPAVRELVHEKHRWIDTVPTAALARRRCHAIRAANEQLSIAAEPLRRDLLARVAPLEAAIHARNVLRSRAYPWCFFPEKTLKSFLLLEKG